MAFPTVDEFRERIVAGEGMAELVKEQIFGGDDVFVFNGMPTAYQKLRQILALNFKVAQADIAVVGSGKFGYSQAPGKFPALFHAKSDIDVVVVGAAAFDELWHALLAWNYPRLHNYLPKPTFAWHCDRRDEVYTGFLAPAFIRTPNANMPGLKKVQGIATHWFSTLKGLSVHREFARHEVKARLYRSWEHASHYHLDGLKLLRKRLTEGAGR